MLHIPPNTWKVLILLGAGLVMLMLAEVAAAANGLDKKELRSPSPIEKAIDPTSDIRHPPYRVWNPSGDPRPDLVPFMRTVRESAGICTVRISVRNIGETGVPQANLLDTTEARSARTLLKTYWQIRASPDAAPEDHLWISALPHHMNLRWGHRVTGEQSIYALAPGQCVEGEMDVDTHGALPEASEANNVTPPGLLLCCD